MTERQSDEQVFLYAHAHTPFSNIYEAETGRPSNDNHRTDYVSHAKASQADNMVFLLADHWRTPGHDYFDQVRERVDEEDGLYDYTEYDTHAILDADGTETVLVNGVEGSWGERRHHTLFYGVDLDVDAGFYNLDDDEVYRIAREEAALTAPAHPFIPTFTFPEQKIDRLFLEAAGYHGFHAALEYPTGYHPVLNRAGRGAFRSLRGKRSVLDFDDYIVGQDIHLTPPQDYEGAGYLSGEDAEQVMRSFEDGEIPVAALVNTSIVGGEGIMDEGLSTGAFVTAYPDLVPFGLAGPLTPQTEEEYEAVRARSREGLDRVDEDGVADRVYDPSEDRMRALYTDMGL